MNILNAEKISKTYGEKVLFDKVVLGVNKGDKIGVIGVNGTGKSTFLKIIAGIEEPDAGEIVSGRGVTVSYLILTLRSILFPADREKGLHLQEHLCHLPRFLYLMSQPTTLTVIWLYGLKNILRNSRANL